MDLVEVHVEAADPGKVWEVTRISKGNGATTSIKLPQWMGYHCHSEETKNDARSVA